MAFYEDKKSVRETDSADQYRKERSIGSKPNAPGIYKCQKCGYEDVINRECEKLPPCSNCKKKGNSNTWKFLVKATDK